MDKTELREKIQTHLAQNIVTNMKDKEELVDAVKEADELLRASYNLLNTEKVKSVEFLWEPRAFKGAKNFEDGDLVNVEVKLEGDEEKQGPYKAIVIGAAATYTNSLTSEEKITIEYAGHQDAVFIPELGKTVRAHEIISTDRIEDSNGDNRNIADVL